VFLVRDAAVSLLFACGGKGTFIVAPVRDFFETFLRCGIQGTQKAKRIAWNPTLCQRVIVYFFFTG
jgi:hypothetical protein